MKMPRVVDLSAIAALVALIASLITAAACKTVPPVVSEGVETGIDCAKESIAEIAKDNLLNVEMDLLRDNWKDVLKSDALKLGQDVVACLIEYIVTRSRADAARASSDINTHTKIARGDEWLKTSRVKFARPLQ